MTDLAFTQERLLKEGRELAGRLRREWHALSLEANAGAEGADVLSLKRFRDCNTVRLLVEALEDRHPEVTPAHPRADVRASAGISGDAG